VYAFFFVDRMLCVCLKITKIIKLGCICSKCEALQSGRKSPDAEPNHVLEGCFVRETAGVCAWGAEHGLEIRKRQLLTLFGTNLEIPKERITYGKFKCRGFSSFEWDFRVRENTF